MGAGLAWMDVVRAMGCEPVCGCGLLGGASSTASGGALVSTVAVGRATLAVGRVIVAVGVGSEVTAAECAGAGGSFGPCSTVGR